VSFSETLFLFFLALVVFGPKKLPEIARQVGKILNEFRRASNEFKSQIEQEIAHLEVEDRKKTELPASPAPAGTTSRSAAPVEAAPATLAASPEVTAGNGASSPVSATEAVASAEPTRVDAVSSASSELSSSPASSAGSQDIPQEASQDTSQSHFQNTHSESPQESQESHA
jgi:sec-independent protein translocase protein TatB